MSFIKSLYSIVLDALFPISKPEQEVLAMDDVHAFQTLPRAKKSPIPEACSIFSYKNDKVWRLVWAIKYKKSLRAAKIAAFALFRSLSSFREAASPVVIVPMPITKRRRRERGYNQCELILDELEKLDVDRSFTYTRGLLTRTKHKTRQTLKDREDRLESAHDIFKVDNEVANRLLDSLKNAPNYLLIVIDDVVTTGSTIRDAIETLRRAGFEKTFGLSVAH